MPTAFPETTEAWTTTHDRLMISRIAALRIMRTDRMEEKLPRVRVPALVVRGSRHNIAPQAWIEQAARLLSGAQDRRGSGAPLAVNDSAPRAAASLGAGLIAETGLAAKPGDVKPLEQPLLD